MKRILLCLVGVSTLGFGIAQDEVPADAEILWDSWGVPHIYAETEEDLMYAWGWAQMRSHGDTTDPDSPFFANQLALYAAKQYRPIWRTRDAVEADLELREVLLR